MRETIARIAVMAMAGVLVALAGAVAWRDARSDRPIDVAGPSPRAAGEKAESLPELVSPVLLVRGEELFRERGCRSCHSLAAQGNPGLPLDDVGRRRAAIEIGPWITGVGLPAEALPTAVRRRKAGYAEMPAEDLAALTAFLAAQRADPP
jgi:hypothetical protein